MTYELIEKYDRVLSNIDNDELKMMIEDQIAEPGESVENYFKEFLIRSKKADQIDFAVKVSHLLEERFPITIEDDSREDVEMVYTLYKLLVLNLISGLTIFLSNFIVDFSKKKSFLKTYSNLKTFKTNRNISKEAYIIITNTDNIISDICGNDVDIKIYLEYLIKGSNHSWPSYILDCFLAGKVNDEGIVQRKYELVKKSGLLDSITTKVVMDYNNKYITSNSITFNSEETELEGDIEIMEELYNE